MTRDQESELFQLYENPPSPHGPFLISIDFNWAHIFGLFPSVYLIYLVQKYNKSRYDNTLNMDYFFPLTDESQIKDLRIRNKELQKLKKEFEDDLILEIKEEKGIQHYRINAQEIRNTLRSFAI